MDDKKIRAFLTIIQLGSLRRAAQELNYTQSGLTQMMKHLEQGGGLPPAPAQPQRRHDDRERRAPAPPIFRRRIRRFLQLRHESEQFSGPQRKTIVIGAFPSIAKRWLPQRIQRFRLLHPRFSSTCVSAGTRLPTGRRSAAWISRSPTRCCAAAASGFPCSATRCWPSFRAAARRTRTRASMRSCWGAAVYHAGFARPARAHPAWGRSQLRQTVSISSDDDSALLSLVRQGLGVTILPEMSLETADSGVSVRPLSPPMQRTVGILLPAAPPPSPAASQSSCKKA